MIPALVATLALAGANPSLPQVSNRAPAWHRAELATPTVAEPRRIVSLAPVVTETLFRLGQGARVVGVTRFCDRPAEATTREKVGGYVDISLEKVLQLKPDLVVAMPSMGQREVLDRLRERGIPVRVVFADSLDEARALITDLGALTASQDAAAALRKRLDDAAAGLGRIKVPARRTAVLVGHDPLVVAGPGTFAAEVVGLTGLVPAVPADAPMWPVWSVESLAAADVEVLIVAEGPVVSGQLRALLDRALPPGKRPTLVAGPNAMLMRPGPALIEDMEILQRLLRPLAPDMVLEPKAPAR